MTTRPLVSALRVPPTSPGGSAPVGGFSSRVRWLAGLVALTAMGCTAAAELPADPAGEGAPPGPGPSASVAPTDAGAPTDGATASDGGDLVARDGAPGRDAGASDAGPIGTTSCSSLRVVGDPTSTRGATWSYASTDDGVVYDLTGILLAPSTTGTHPAVVVSHGKGGSASGYAMNVGQTMRPWGLVVIATNYTHAQVPGGAPTGDQGASAANVQRLMKARALLRCLAYVDATRVGAHGHSMGALLTAAAAGTYPTQFMVASHTAGGVSDTGAVNDGVPTTTVAQAMGIRAPYQMHHGDQDTVVPLALDQRLAQILTAGGTTNELHVYAGVDHPGVSLDAQMFSRVRGWYTTHGLLR